MDKFTCPRCNHQFQAIISNNRFSCPNCQAPFQVFIEDGKQKVVYDFVDQPQHLDRAAQHSSSLENVPQQPQDTHLPQQSIVSRETKRKKGPLFSIGIIILVMMLWVIVRPGVFTIQPIGAIPDGITFVYHSRNPEMPFFSSPDGICLEIQGGVSLLCRGTVLAASKDLTDRIILRLPYIHWAYLLSTGGREFDR